MTAAAVVPAASLGYLLALAVAALAKTRRSASTRPGRGSSVKTLDLGSDPFVPRALSSAGALRRADGSVDFRV